MVIRKLTLIIVLAIVFGAFLVVQPRYQQAPQQTSIEDRLPESTWKCIVNCVALSKEINHLLFRYQIPYRDFLSADFILAQAKMYGIQLQEPAFIFYNSIQDFGVVAHLSERANLKLGIERLKYFFDVQEVSIDRQKIYKIPKYKAYLFHGHNYICLYVGEHFTNYFKRIVEAKPNQIAPEWIPVVHNYQQLGKSVLLHGTPQVLTDLNVEYIEAVPSFDSTQILIHTQLLCKDTVPFRLKNMGTNFIASEFTKRALNLHIDPSYLQTHPQHVFYSFLQQQSAKIRFPFDDFIRQWDGDLCFKQGGWQTIHETYIDFEWNDDFEISEVVKTQQKQVVGMDVFYSLNEHATNIRKQLKKTGFLTVQDKKNYLLLSPPLNFKQLNENTRTTNIFYTGNYLPPMQQDANSYLLWTHQQTQYTLYIDSVSTFEIYGNLRFSPEKWRF